MKNNIGWTHATVNPLVGCSDARITDPDTGNVTVSPTCPGCYAKGQVNRGMAKQHRGLTVLRDHGPDWTGEVRLVPKILERTIPRPRHGGVRRVFAPSLSDPFHETLIGLDRLGHPREPPTFTPARREFVVAMLGWMVAQPWVDWQVLTKRAAGLEGFMTWLEQSPWPLGEQLARALDGLWLTKHAATIRTLTPTSFGNIIFGCTVENDLAARARLPHLVRLRTTSTLVENTFVSYEPALGRVDFAPYLHGIDWLIIGGESGPRARPMHPEWVSSAIGAAYWAHVPVFFKQWGEWSPYAERVCPPRVSVKSRVVHDEVVGDRVMNRVGRKEAGQRLDGGLLREWPCLRGDQRSAFTTRRGGLAADRSARSGGWWLDHAVWPTRKAAEEAARGQTLSEVLELKLPRPYKRSVYVRAEGEDFGHEQDRLSVHAEVVAR